MLKALEIVGFKSFADKTRFVFPPGITAVVGPNGAGKSNIVDAIKWVLGEQSVKSLRGREMADVIFNGSPSRRATNSAEITVTFDNQNHLLPIDTPEVHITRRVYRSGEGEYLINRQPSRLRDIREILSGTGMGTQAYSVIEQGKVDVLLQSSAKDRRLIFEEAAGISLFKAKKIEALRRLERVEQNLLRLSDIVDEVDSRLRGVRAQAGKARRYKEHTDRLQELRTQVAMVDWHRLSQRLAAVEAELAELTASHNQKTAEGETIEVRLLQIDAEVGEINESIRTSEARLAENRERIAGREAALEHERRRGRDLEQEIAQCRQRLVQMNARAGNLAEQFAQTSQAVADAREHCRRTSQRLAEDERALAETIDRIVGLRAEHKRREAVHLDQLRGAGELGNQLSALVGQAEAATDALRQGEARLAELDRQIAELDEQSARLGRKADEAADASRRREDELAEGRSQLVAIQDQLTAAQDELAERRAQHGGATQRVAVLEDLERRREGLNAGVKEVLSQAQNAGDGPFSEVVGLVADLIRVSVESAPLVEVALGGAAQRVVLRDSGRMRQYLAEGTHRFAGRVGFLALDGPAAPATADLDGQPGVLGRADRFVETDPAHAALARRLLGGTWLVETLSEAMALIGPEHPGVRLVTLAGELIEADGTIVVGPPRAVAGLISRRSELRELKTQLADLENDVRHATVVVEEYQSRRADQQRRVAALENDRRRAADALAEQRHQVVAADQRRAQLDGQRQNRQAELAAARARLDKAQQVQAGLRARREQAEAALADGKAALDALSAQLETLDAQRQQEHHAATEAKVELAKSQERLLNLQTRLRQCEETQQERDRAVAEGRQQLTQCRHRAGQSQWSILRAESEIAELYLRKESFATATGALVQKRDELGAARGQWTSDLQRLRAKLRKVEERIHAAELAAGDVRHERGALADRIREAYQIELAELDVAPTAEEQQRREQAQQEIDDLRRRIDNLGNVNLEALAELEELEARHAHLSAQHKDLSDARNELVRIIERINADSRRLFFETLETVRGHFVQLFRDLFGGGQADIVLEEDVDVLESGIEIVARPPGKEPRSISLLSGGEKTLTCVALLLAIFRSRPSPFCVLDEVDAALDEANIGRFTEVLKGFLTWTQFIIVTHSKKTMTCADTIYGVTMQESGISKQVSVRFEDVSEDGHFQYADEEDAAASEPSPDRAAAKDGTQAA
ncbi:MAG: chromosome segregation protein SMC [Pirellulales bacterium]|nr:chromosome segregation protein SMC [Pirellulales bacterium]